MEQYLFVIDYQNDFVDGALGFPHAAELDAGIAEKIRAYGPGHVFFTLDTHQENYLQTREGRSLPVVHCVEGTHGWALYGQTAQALAACGAKGIHKTSFGIDYSNPAVASILPARADRIELVGLVSNICVVSNAAVLQSRYPEAQIVVTPRSPPASTLSCTKRFWTFWKDFRWRCCTGHETSFICGLLHSGAANPEPGVWPRHF